MNILILMSQLPFRPDTGAKIRTFNLIRELAPKHDITIVAYGRKKKDLYKARALEKFCREIVIVERHAVFGYLKLLEGLFSRLPYGVIRYSSGAMKKALEKLTSSKKYDLIHCDSLQMSLNMRGIKGIPRLLTEHNIESEIVRRLAEKEKEGLRKAFLGSQYLKLKRYEIEACRSFPNVVTVSELDRGYLADHVNGEKLHVVPNGVDAAYFRPGLSREDEPSPERAKDLVFTGSMDWPPNEDAVVYFSEQILPLIWNWNPEVRFSVVGRAPSKRVLDLGAQDDRVRVTGEVDDVRPYIDGASVFVVPLRVGGGTRLKILEAMAMARPVVSTPVGAEGLLVTERENIVIAKTPYEFAGVVLELLSDKGRRDTLGKAGRKLVEDKYGWDRIAPELDKVWFEASGAGELPILLYHDIAGDDDDITSVDARRKPYVLKISEFERQMKYLHDEGFRTVGLDEFPSLADHPQKNKLVAIVFDDGLMSNYRMALPVLMKYGQKAAFFITAGRVGENGMMDWDQIIRLKKAGMTIGSHSMSHSIPLELDQDELRYELRGSKELLEEKLDAKIDLFSSPTGYHDPRLARTARMCGYAKMLVSKPRLNKLKNRFILSKTSIKRGYSFGKFIRIVERKPAEYVTLSAEHGVRKGMRAILGYKGYEFLRAGILGGVR
ncbi:MAG: glycosyltransferase [Candidatus Omnitrophica bacterium]|nr:glycosyltransferase [Candidatus Omnitrophota bacterium]